MRRWTFTAICPGRMRTKRLRLSSKFMRWLLLLASSLAAADLDQDTLPDKFEQQLLERFVPRFMVSTKDCDVLPAEFARHESAPRPVSRNGTLYGFVTLRDEGEIELHYYHLWARDCGRGSHPLDVEHVSALLRNPNPDHTAKHWHAVAWMAAGHQGTICDTAHGARAHLLDAAKQGPTVWISQGKHASFLSQKLCSRGCGGDRCENMQPWRPRAVVNVGSVEHPMNGSEWIQSKQWALKQKLRPEFSSSVQTVIAQSEGIANLYPVLVPVKATVFAGDATLDAVGTGKRHAGGGVATGASSVAKSLKKAKRAVSSFLAGR